MRIYSHYGWMWVPDDRIELEKWIERCRFRLEERYDSVTAAYLHCLECVLDRYRRDADV